MELYLFHSNFRQLIFPEIEKVFSFGTLSKFYKNMKNADEKIVAKSFGVGYRKEEWVIMQKT